MKDSQSTNIFPDESLHIFLFQTSQKCEKSIICDSRTESNPKKICFNENSTNIVENIPSNPAKNGQNTILNVKISADLFIGEQIPGLLSCKHWLEVLDPKHRYGTYLRPYYEAWCKIYDTTANTENFFNWLDSNNGFCLENLMKASFGDKSCENEKISTTKTIVQTPSFSSPQFSYPYLSSIPHVRHRHIVSRKHLEMSTVTYCTEKERNFFLVEIEQENSILRWACRKNKPKVDTQDQNRWIFVIDEDLRFYINMKKKASFHHSSFVSGASVRAAGRIDVLDGKILSVAPNSGHYLTSMPQLLRALFELFGDCTLPIASFKYDQSE